MQTLVLAVASNNHVWQALCLISSQDMFLLQVMHRSLCQKGGLRPRISSSAHITGIPRQRKYNGSVQQPPLRRNTTLAEPQTVARNAPTSSAGTVRSEHAKAGPVGRGACAIHSCKGLDPTMLEPQLEPQALSTTESWSARSNKKVACL